MTKTPEKLYRFHTENLRAIRAALDEVYRNARVAIGRSRDSSRITYERLYALLMGAWIECRLLKMLYEDSAFSPKERSTILSDDTLLGRWTAAIEVAFRKHYGISKAPLATSLKPTARMRLEVMNRVINSDLRAVITLRNKLAHGQWAYPLNDDLNDVAQDQVDAFRNENVLTLKQKASLIEALCSAVNDLALSIATFERDFDEHFKLIDQIRRNLANRTYQAWVDRVRSTHQKGQEAMRKNLRTMNIKTPPPGTP